MSNRSDRIAQLSTLQLALLAKQTHDQVNDILQAEPIAIIGMGCRFPGGADSPQAFWKLLVDKVSAMREVPEDRWDIDQFYDADFSAPGKMNNRRGGFLDKIDQFDPGFFGIPEREAAQMDPQQRIVLEVAYEALDDAGLTHEHLSGSQTGVFVASFHNDYARLVYNNLNGIDLRTLTGTLHSIVSNRISYLLNLRGPSVTMDTACSSSLVAVHLACQSLRSRETDVCLAGGVNIVITPGMNVALSKVGFISPSGQCLTFDASADGFVRGEGCGMIVLKRLSDALANDDRVIAVIRGSAVNQDGRSTVLTAPNGMAQQDVVRRAIKNAALTPDKIGNIETHGTGTHLGDPIEVEALAQVIPSRGTDSPPCYLTAVKANIGHLEGAAGVAGVIKTAMSLWEEQIPAHPTFKQLNPNITLDGTPFRISTDLVDWKAGETARNAGVSSFGVGGTNAHVVLSESPTPKPQYPPSVETGKSMLLPVSARSPRALVDYLAAYERFLRDPQNPAPLPDITATASLRRNHYEYRFATAGASRQQLADRLGAFLLDPERLEAEIALNPVEESPRIAFVFSGQGTQWPRMARDLIDQEPLFREKIEACDRLLQPLAGWSLLEKLTAGPEDSTLDQTEVAQPAIFAVQVALDALWRSWGVIPEAVVGHSLGEIAAAYISGGLKLEEAIHLVYHRGLQMQGATGKGKMASLDLPQQVVSQRVLKDQTDVSIAAINSPHSTVISGPSEAIDAIISQMKSQNVNVRPLKVNYAFHHPQMEPYARALTSELASLSPRASKIQMVSTVTGQEINGESLNADYWGDNIRRPVQFAQAIDRLIQMGITVFVEIGPHPALTAMVEQCAAGKESAFHALASLRRDLPGRDTLMATAAKLYQFGAPIHWRAFHPDNKQPVTLPSYPWQRKRYWISNAQLSVNAPQEDTHPLLGTPLRSPVMDGVLFQKRIQAATAGYLADHRWMDHAIVPAAALLEMAASGAAEAFGVTHPIIEEVMFHEALFLPADLSRSLQVHFQKETPDQAGFEIFAETVDKDWSRCASGKIRLSGAPFDEGVELNIDAVKTLCNQRIEGESFYDHAQTANAGVEFGPAFQNVQEIWRADGEALAVLSMNEFIAPDQSRYTLHPAMLDSLLQPLSAALPHPAAGSVYLPWSIQRMVIFDRLQDEVWSHVSIEPDPSNSGETFTGHVDVFDSRGNRLVEIAGIVLKRAQPSSLLAALEHTNTDGVQDWFYQIQWEQKPATGLTAAQPGGRWLIFSHPEEHTKALSVELAERIRQAGGEYLQVLPGEIFQPALDGQVVINPARPEDFQQLMHSLQSGSPVSNILYLWGMNTPPLDSINPSILQPDLNSLLALVQSIFKTVPDKLPSLVLVTSGARAAGRVPSHPEQAPVWGFANTLRLEHPDLPCICLDLDAQMAIKDQAESVIQTIQDASQPGSDQRIAYTQISGSNEPIRLVERLDVLDLNNPLRQTSPTRLEIGNLGSLDTLRLTPMQRQEPGPGEVEIEVLATGLNFRDVLKALGSYPGMVPGAQVLLGDECAGRISKVGSGVDTLTVGQPVIALANGSLASYVTTTASLVVEKPSELSYEEAAGIPIPYLTAWYTLYHLANLQPGQRVLIHAAAGGVGMAAVQLAKRAGAEIFATAGSPEKRAYLQSLGIKHVLDSRSLDFAPSILAITAGEGVDVVLNSLAGEFITTSLSVLKTGGCFLEIGRTGILSPSQAAQMRPDARYYPVFLGDLYTSDPALVREMLSGIIEARLKGEIHSLPRHSFDIQEAETAFRLMARARHTGKIVLTQPGLADEPLHFQADGVYLITGGLGGIGQVVSRWMVEHGARKLALVSRSGAQTADAQKAVDELRESGAQVDIYQADVSDYYALKAVLEKVQSTLTPLRGVIHAAGVNEDGVILQQTGERFEHVMASKAVGAFNLHQLTSRVPLDHFVLFSSIAGPLGSQGQSSYSAANAYLQALALARRADGLPALCLNWGAWGSTGMTARLSKHSQEELQRRGLGWITPDAGMKAFEQALRQSNPDVIILPVDWPEYLSQVHPSSLPYFERVMPRSTARSSTNPAVPQASQDKGKGPSELVRRYLETPASRRRSYLMSQIQQAVARLVGFAPDTAIDPLTPLNTLGLDSLMAVEMRNYLSQSFGTSLPATLLFDYPTSDALATYLISHVPTLQPEDKQQEEMGKPGAAAGAASRDILELTDEEAEAELLAELLKGQAHD